MVIAHTLQALCITVQACELLVDRRDRALGVGEIAIARLGSGSLLLNELLEMCAETAHRIDITLEALDGTLVGCNIGCHASNLGSELVKQ